jgi:hypothetical protein
MQECRNAGMQGEYRNAGECRGMQGNAEMQEWWVRISKVQKCRNARNVEMQ